MLMELVWRGVELGQKSTFRGIKLASGAVANYPWLAYTPLFIPVGMLFYGVARQFRLNLMTTTRSREKDKPIDAIRLELGKTKRSQILNAVNLAVAKREVMKQRLRAFVHHDIVAGYEWKDGQKTPVPLTVFFDPSVSLHFILYKGPNGVVPIFHKDPDELLRRTGYLKSETSAPGTADEPVEVTPLWTADFQSERALHTKFFRLFGFGTPTFEKLEQLTQAIFDFIAIPDYAKNLAAPIHNRLNHGTNIKVEESSGNIRNKHGIIVGGFVSTDFEASVVRVYNRKDKQYEFFINTVYDADNTYTIDEWSFSGHAKSFATLKLDAGEDIEEAQKSIVEDGKKQALDLIKQHFDQRQQCKEPWGLMNRKKPRDIHSRLNEMWGILGHIEFRKVVLQIGKYLLDVVTSFGWKLVRPFFKGIEKLFNQFMAPLALAPFNLSHFSRLNNFAELKKYGNSKELMPQVTAQGEVMIYDLVALGIKEMKEGKHKKLKGFQALGVDAYEGNLEIKVVHVNALNRAHVNRCAKYEADGIMLPGSEIVREDDRAVFYRCLQAKHEIHPEGTTGSVVRPIAVNPDGPENSRVTLSDGKHITAGKYPGVKVTFHRDPYKASSRFHLFANHAG